MSTFNNAAYNETCTFGLAAYNAINGSVSYSLGTYGGKAVRVDTVSTVRSNQVTSGTVTFPSTAGTEFGATYTNTTSLATNIELQQINGYFTIPPSVDYTNVFPSSLNYTGINTGVSYRWATFVFTVTTPIANSLITFNGQQGTGWGSGSTLASGFLLYIRFIDTSLSTDSHWLDANKFYTGVGYPQNDGDACLLVSNTTSNVKSVTFGLFRKGMMYIRIGVDAQNTSYGKSFTSVTHT